MSVGRPKTRQGDYERITLEVSPTVLQFIDSHAGGRRAFVEKVMLDCIEQEKWVRRTPFLVHGIDSTENQVEYGTEDIQEALQVRAAWILAGMSNVGIAHLVSFSKSQMEYADMPILQRSLPSLSQEEIDLEVAKARKAQIYATLALSE